MEVRHYVSEGGRTLRKEEEVARSRRNKTEVEHTPKRDSSQGTEDFKEYRRLSPDRCLSGKMPGDITENRVFVEGFPGTESPEPQG